MNAFGLFEIKPSIFGYGVMGLRAANNGACPLLIFEWDEFKPFLKFRALDNLDFWERFTDVMSSFAPLGPFVLYGYGIPRLDELVSNELWDMDDTARKEFYKSTEERLTAAAKLGHGFAQKLLGDYYARIRENGFGGDVGKALHWYGEAAKSGIIDLNGDYEEWDDEEFDEEIELYLNCGTFSWDDVCGRDLE